MRLGVYGPLAGRWQRLKSGESRTIDIVLTVKDDPDSLRTAKSVASDAAKVKALLSSTDTGFSLSEFGKYQLSAMIGRVPLADEQKKALREREGIEAQEIWVGRTVSKPVEVELRPPAEDTE